MLESTMAKRVVGICKNGIPRINVEAINPDKSPITPPPRAKQMGEKGWTRKQKVLTNDASVSATKLINHPIFDFSFDFPAFGFFSRRKNL